MKVRESVNLKHGYMSCQLLMMNLCDSFIIQYLVVINLLIIIGKNSFRTIHTSINSQDSTGIAYFSFVVYHIEWSQCYDFFK